MRPIHIAVHGATNDSRKRWENYAHSLKFIFLPSDKTVFQVFNEMIDDSELHYLLYCDSEVWVGPEVESSVRSLIEELDGHYAYWGACSGVGVRFDGDRIYNYIRRPPSNPEDGVSPKPVINIGRGLILINLALLRERGIKLREFDSNIGFDIALSIELLLAKIPLFADRRLIVSHFPKEPWSLELLSQNKELLAFLGERLINHTVYTVYGPLSITETTDLSYLALPPKQSRKVDLINLYDEVVRESRKYTPTVNVVVRTTLERRYLLERTIASFAAMHLKTDGLIAAKLTLISESPQKDLDGIVASYRVRFPNLEISGNSFLKREGRFSRVDAMLHAIEGCKSDFIWFVDDDDFLFPDGAKALGRILMHDCPIVFTGNCRTYEEKWISERLSEFHETSLIPSHGIFRAFSGENHTPFCGMVLPVKPLQLSLKDAKARGDYLEDYFILLKLLSSARVEIEALNVDIAGISHRGSENTVRDTNRSHWNYSYAAFFQELLSNDENSRPIIWQLARS